MELATHLGDAGSVVADRAEGVFRHDHAGGGQHAHATQGDEVQREREVPTADGQGDTEGDGDGDDGVDRRLEAAGSTRKHDRGRTGLGGLGDLANRAVVGAGVVLGQPADQLRQHETDGDRTEALPAGVGLVVADIREGDDQRADQRQGAGHEEAAVDRLDGVRLVGPGLHSEHAGDRGDHTDGTSGNGEHQAERRVGADRLERGDAEDDRGDERDLVALEQVGGHAGAVTHVVADVVSDGRRVARVVFGDTRFDLADEVGTDVGSLGEDAATDAQEQGQQRTTEAEADEDDRRRVLEQGDDRGGAQQAEADGEHAGHATGAEGDGQRIGHRPFLGCGCSAHVASRCQGHADEPGATRRRAAEDERQRAPRAGQPEAQRLAPVRLLDRGRRQEDDDCERHQDHGDGLELPAEVCRGALLDRLGDLFHLRCALVGRQDVLRQ